MLRHQSFRPFLRFERANHGQQLTGHVSARSRRKGAQKIMTSLRKEGELAALQVYRLGDHFAQLVEGNGCVPVEVDADFWMSGVDALPSGRLLSVVDSDHAWTSWEMHPHGEEFILQLKGVLALILEINGKTNALTLNAGEFAIVPRGIWHTADVPIAGSALFITPGDGTANRPRL
jgi:mannose-6-phosphate isomerase-like protein (cupin superfamily)